VQRFLTGVVFLRASAERAAAQLREPPGEVQYESEYVLRAARTIADFFSAPRFELAEWNSARLPEKATAVLDSGKSYQVQNWVHAAAPIRYSRGDALLLLLSSRRGGRRYLSEDLESLDRLTSIVAEQVERIRSSEMQALVSQAELRALQAQINPHFFFNALNTLYGVIARENSAARRLVLNLAGLFRYSFAVNSGSSPLSEEIRIVRAYLEIEELRLGPKLTTDLQIDESVLSAEVPILSIQPLVENAVKHGAASREGGGFVRLSIQRVATSVVVEVSNSGLFHESPQNKEGTGIGMANVRRRLALRYGESSDLQIIAAGDTTTVRFMLPAPKQELADLTVA
jgi:sensor histidine kinase YesM